MLALKEYYLILSLSLYHCASSSCVCLCPHCSFVCLSRPYRHVHSACLLLNAWVSVSISVHRTHWHTHTHTHANKLAIRNPNKWTKITSRCAATILLSRHIESGQILYFENIRMFISQCAQTTDNQARFCAMPIFALHIIITIIHLYLQIYSFWNTETISLSEQPLGLASAISIVSPFVCLYTYFVSTNSISLLETRGSEHWSSKTNAHTYFIHSFEIDSEKMEHI